MSARADRTFAIAADLLEEGARIDAWSRGLAIVAVILLAVESGAAARLPWILAIAAGAAQAYLAVRTAFDRRLLRGLAEGGDLGDFDAAMAALGLMHASKMGRDPAARCRGAVRLLGMQGVALAVQVACLGWAATLADPKLWIPR